jgi:hypothetical protein
VPIWSTPTPEVEEDGKGIARNAFQLVDHETNILARTQKLNIQADKWETLNSLAMPPKQA